MFSRNYSAPGTASTLTPNLSPARGREEHSPLPHAGEGLGVRVVDDPQELNSYVLSVISVAKTKSGIGAGQ